MAAPGIDARPNIDTEALKATVIFGAAASLIVAVVASVINVGVSLTFVWILPMLGFFSLIAANFAFPKEQRDLFAPINLVAISTLIGAVIRSIYVVFFDDPMIDRVFLLGEQRTFMLDASLLIFITTVAISISYARTRTYINMDRLFSKRRFVWKEGRLLPLILFLSIIGIFGMYIYVRSLGVTITSLDDLSGKRTLKTNAGGVGYAALGYVAWMANMAKLGFLLAFTQFAHSGAKIWSRWGVLSIFTGLIAMAMPFFQSARGELIMTFGLAIIVWHFLRKPVSLKFLGGFALVGLIVASVMGTFRSGFDDAAELTSSLVPTESVQGIVDTKNFFDLAKTAHIVADVPEKLPYRYGETYLLWLYAPIPRTMWPDKPVISIGQTVGEEVFNKPKGRAGGGVPPGLVGELYWNFGMIGIIPGALIYGFILAFVFRSFRKYFATDPNSVIVYVFLANALGFFLIGGDFSRVMISLGTTMIPLTIVLWILSRKYQDQVPPVPA